MSRELAGSSRTMLWSSDYSFHNGGSQNPLYEFDIHQDHDSAFVLYCTEAANKRIKLSPRDNDEQAKVADALLSLGPLRLKLNLTPTFLDSVEKNLNNPRSAANLDSVEKNLNQPRSAAKAYHQRKVNDFGSQTVSEKLKASNFPALFLRIGQWERSSVNEGDLVAKCYYAKKKLVWELLERGLKSKIEIQWNDIIAMRASIHENKPGVLEIELNQTPSFHEENDPQPRKHTIWRPASDFTGGQATICRRHYISFPPGSLDKHYEKLVQCDRKMYELSQKPYPSLKSPYFESNICDFSNLSLDFGTNSQDINPRLEFNFRIPSTLVATTQVQAYEQAPLTSLKETPSPISVMDFSHSDEHISNNVIENPRMIMWGEGINNNLAAGDTFAHGVPFTQVNPAVSCQGYSNPLTYGQGVDPNGVDTILSNLAEQLFSDAKLDGVDEKACMERVQSWNNLVHLPQEKNPAREEKPHQGFWGQETGLVDNLILGANEQTIGFGGGQVYQQPVSGFSSQVCPQNPPMYHPWNNLTYSAWKPDPRNQNFGPVNTINRFNSMI